MKSLNIEVIFLIISIFAGLAAITNPTQGYNNINRSHRSSSPYPYPYPYPAEYPPYISSIIRVSTNPSSAASVDFTVIFSESVTGVDMTGPTFDDFTLTMTGNVTGATVSGVSGTGNTYTVTVNTGIGNGTIRLDVPEAATIIDLTGNPLVGLPFITGDAYIVDKVFNVFLPLVLR